MRLYRMELYKLCHKKVFIIEAVFMLGIMFAYFWFTHVCEEICVVEDKSYSGYKAIQMNRKITEEFSGIITDGKINQIVERYGLPSKHIENMPEWRDANYLNDFVTEYFTDGDWRRNMLPTEMYTLEETELRTAYEALGITPTIAYKKGWEVFCDMTQFGLVLGSILVICGISVVFSDEVQTKTLPIIFTTEEGRKKDISAKIEAALTLTILIFTGIVLFNLILCKAVYGLDGFESVSGVVLSGKISMNPIYRTAFSKYLGILLGTGFCALMTLCSITLCISAHRDSSFSAVVISAISWGLPIFIRMFPLGIIVLVVYSAPIFLVTGIISDVYVSDVNALLYIIYIIDICIFTGCLINGAWHYKKKQAA